MGYQKIDLTLFMEDGEVELLQRYADWVNGVEHHSSDPVVLDAIVHVVLFRGLEEWSKEQRKNARHAAEDRCRELLPDATSADLWAFSWRVMEGISEDQALNEILDARRRDHRNTAIQPRLNINDQLRMKQDGLL